MRHRSTLWTKLAAQGRFGLDVRAVIDGKTYTAISAPRIDRNVMEEPLTVGNVNTASLQFSVLTEDIIPDGASVTIEAQMLSEDQTEIAETAPFGTFWIDQREKVDNLYTFTCYDAMMRTLQPMLADGELESDWPQTMTAVVRDIAYRIGVPIDPRTLIRSGAAYMVPYPKNRTMQQVLGFIGACHGGNWIVTEEGMLRLVPLVSAPADTCHILSSSYEEILTSEGDYLSWALTEEPAVTVTAAGNPVPSLYSTSYNLVDQDRNRLVTSDGFYLVWATDGSVDAVDGLVRVPVVIGGLSTGQSITVSGVTMTDEDGNSYTAGSDDGYVLTISSNPYACQAICNDLYTMLSGLKYQPFTATQACFDPATELGDQVKIKEQVCSIICTMSIKLDTIYRADIQAPASKEMSSEYPMTDPKRTSMLQQAAAAAKAMVDKFAAVVQENLSDLQGQVDGKTETWFYSAAPTLENAPAKDWATAEQKANHTDDLYYDTTAGHCYRWTGTAWEQIKDADVTAAMKAASEAKDTADGKRRVFTAQPAPPYEVGDLWVQGTAGDVMVCIVTRASGSYTAADWGAASKYAAWAYNGGSSMDGHQIYDGSVGWPQLAEDCTFKLLWQVAAGHETDSFPAGSVTLSSSLSYDAYLIVCKDYALAEDTTAGLAIGDDYSGGSTLLPINQHGCIYGGNYFSVNGTKYNGITIRYVTPYARSVFFGNGTVIANGVHHQNNKACVPYRIYGVKIGK